MEQRHNPDLDDVFLGASRRPTDLPKPAPTKTKASRGRRRPSLAKDEARRMAFRVLALLSGHGSTERQRILRLAAKLSNAG